MNEQHRTHWTAEEEALLRYLYETRQLKTSEVAHALGRTAKAVLKKATDLGVRKKTRAGITPDKMEQIWKMLLGGQATRFIAQMTGTSVPTVDRLRQDLLFKDKSDERRDRRPECRAWLEANPDRRKQWERYMTKNGRDPGTVFKIVQAELPMPAPQNGVPTFKTQEAIVAIARSVVELQTRVGGIELQLTTLIRELGGADSERKDKEASH